MGLAASKQEAFWEACGFGHKMRVRKFIDDGIDVNWVSYTHNCCAIHVASQGKKEIVQMLLEAGCDVNVKDDRGNLPMHHAAMRGHTEIMEMLLRAGSQLNLPDKIMAWRRPGDKPLSEAMMNGWTSLINAAYWCYPEAVRFLIKHKCDVNYENKDDRSALHEACRSPSEDEEALADIVRQLIEAGADINKKSSDTGEADFTPLMFACYHGHPEVARALIEAKCDIDAQGSKNKWTALHWAADRDHLDLVQVLLQAGVDPLLEGDHEVLAFHRCKSKEVKYLIEQSIIACRGTCETDDELDEDDNEVEKEVEEKKDVDSERIDDYSGNDKDNSEVSSPVSSLPDAMEKDDSNEKDQVMSSEEMSDIGCDGDGVNEANEKLAELNITETGADANGQVTATNGDGCNSSSDELER